MYTYSVGAFQARSEKCSCTILHSVSCVSLADSSLYSASVPVRQPRKEYLTKHSSPAGDFESTPGESRSGPNLLPAADLAAEIERLREQVRQEQDRHIRALADLRNYRRHQENEGKKIAESGKRELMLPLLDIVDDLERSLERAEEGGELLAEGIRLIHRKLLTLLESQGVRPFDSKGKIFTPELHEAVAVKKDRRAKPGTIIDELRRGYLWHDELLRPAQVRVAER